MSRMLKYKEFRYLCARIFNGLKDFKYIHHGKQFTPFHFVR
jgi:hypothetical protein